MKVSYISHQLPSITYVNFNRAKWDLACESGNNAFTGVNAGNL